MIVRKNYSLILEHYYLQPTKEDRNFPLDMYESTVISTLTIFIIFPVLVSSLKYVV